MSANKKILVVDDHPLVRVGVKQIVRSVSNLQVVGEAGTAAEALRLTQVLKPDCLVLGISLPDNSGIYVLNSLAKKPHAPAVLILSMYRQRSKVFEAFRSGALGYINKESCAKILVEGLQTVLRGEVYIDSSLSIKLVDLLRVPADISACPENGNALLTPREQEIIQLLADGKSTKEIGKRLFISPKTVNNHRTNIMKKLGLETNMDIIRHVAKLGLIDISAWKDE